MTKPSEFLEWLACPEHDNLQADDLAWLAYLKGLDDRPVVVPIYIEEPHQLNIYVDTRCPKCNCLMNSAEVYYCFYCGAQLDWSKVE